ncbi:MAG TPA: hypothetical protein VLT88_04150 [Desulfosarcina sp.]|nr:hypothetical protein [Desulfosarcina sp.]
MENELTVEELEARWENALLATRRAAAAHPGIYRRLKDQAAAIVEHPVDINDYFSTVEELVGRLKTLDPGGHGSIFDIFGARIAPNSVWQVRMLRMECKDLLAHLDVFETWRRKTSRLRLVRKSE